MAETPGPPNRWERMEEVFHAAVELAPEARASFLARACGADGELRREVESLLAQHGEGDSLFETPALADAGLTDAGLTNAEPDPGRGGAGWSAGTMIGSYRIVEAIGAGGMGEVFRARDTRLGRDVALKTLGARVSGDRGYLERLRREARLLASLNHPNVATLHGIEEADGVFALVMELVEGETLAKLQGGEPMPVERAIGYARQIAAGLEAAHEKGMIHRDLKPANIKVTPEGTVKILDFGLAKSAGKEMAAEASPSASPTLSLAMTEKGMILGTAAYMSPEQARGQAVDRRADIWAFGVVFYELLTGETLFGASRNVSDSIAAVLTREPDFGALPKGTPGRVRRLLEHCLRKDPKQRLRDIGDARLLLDEAEEKAVAAPVRARWWWVGWSAVAALAALLIPMAVLHLREKAPAAVALRFQIPGGFLSPDGRKVASVSGGRLWVHSLENDETRDLAAAEGATPFWSPDSRFIGYLSQAKLKKIGVAGGSAETITDVRSSRSWAAAAWNRDDVIVFGDRLIGLFRVNASGGAPVQLTSLDPARHENSQYCPSFLPDGRHFFYIRASMDEGKSAIYLGSIDAKPEQQSARALVASNSQPVYAASAGPEMGYLLFVRAGSLMAQPFDNRRLELQGQAVAVAEHITDSPFGAVFVPFSASDNGMVAFRRNSSLSDRRLIWLDREGKETGLAVEQGPYGSPALSPDGKRLALTRNRGAADATSIWLIDLAQGGAGTRFSFGSRADNNPQWSPDGNRIVFSSDREGRFDLYQKPADSSREEEPLLKSGEDKFATSWSRDGRFLLYASLHPKTKFDLWVLDLARGGRQLPLLVSDANERQARLAPDAHWVAYTSDESGQDEIYVRSFAVNQAGTAVEVGGKVPISNGYGVDPRWRDDGRELYYQSRDGRIVAVEIALHPAFRAGKPQPLGASTSTVWDAAPDGRHFLSLGSRGGTQTFTVMLDWQAGLKK